MRLHKGSSAVLIKLQQENSETHPFVEDSVGHDLYLQTVLTELQFFLEFVDLVVDFSLMSLNLSDFIRRYITDTKEEDSQISIASDNKNHVKNLQHSWIYLIFG